MAKVSVHAFFRRVHQFLDRTQQVTTALAGFKDFNAVSGLGLTAQITKLAVELLAKDVTELAKGWNVLVFASEIRDIVEAFCLPFKEAHGEHWDYFIIEGQGVFYDHHEYRYHRFLVEGDPTLFLKMIERSVWATYGNHILLVAKARGYEIDLSLQSYVARPGFGSERAIKVWSRIHPFLKEGKPRSVLLDGRPGTGKSTIAQFLVNQTELLLKNPRILRIPSSDFGYSGSTILQGVVSLTQPAILVIDDFDRLGNVESLLDFLESCRETVQLLVVTTNHLERMAQAVIRPGRFDEIQVIEGLGETFVKDYLGSVWEAMLPAQREIVLSWPVAFLKELLERRRMLSSFPLEDEVMDLKTRLEKKEPPPWWAKQSPAAATPASPGTTEATAAK